VLSTFGRNKRVRKGDFVAFFLVWRHSYKFIALYIGWDILRSAWKVIAGRNDIMQTLWRIHYLELLDVSLMAQGFSQDVPFPERLSTLGVFFPYNLS
jgi:hypothetical protein